MTTTPFPPVPRPDAGPARHAPRRGRPRGVRRLVTFALVVGAAATLAAAAHVLARPDGVPAAVADPHPTLRPATGLDPELERRFDAARAAADADGVELTLTSGWRTAAEQQELVDAALERYGSAEEAHRWVLPPETSEHVAGLAIDVGPTDGALWLEQHGAAFGLCRTYANELWHFEAAVEPGGTCPPMHEDASHGWG
ncbi:M15 family metallopeptidase [Cellulosimicrobium protaetiae]|uniref:M15 family metallopeptidase n=1 Tax=Cellulosimicrobium protaetiae TaxID=2587808 RepID=A0A6M5UGQ1_9MICO|nr:M15 family metallopeptidase [Cellulosimicrobium protaetiae]QJW36238.1 M15 family metallopeptidase [Cellulosimicrobium protaetiae]